MDHRHVRLLENGSPDVDHLASLLDSLRGRGPGAARPQAPGDTMVYLERIAASQLMAGMSDAA
jgi:hypothetical protein